LISDLLVHDSDVMSDLETIGSDLVVLDAIVDTLVTTVSDIGSDITAIETDTTSLISDLLVHDSDVMSDLETIGSDLVVLDAIVDTLVTTVSDIHSDIHAIETDTTQISDMHSDLHAIETDTVAMQGATGIFHEQADISVSVTVSDGAVDILDLNTASTRYLLRDLYLKSTDPGGATITVSLEKLIADSPVVVDTFAINTGNAATYHGLHDMFGTDEIAGDDIHIFIQSSSDVQETVTGQYSYAKTNN